MAEDLEGMAFRAAKAAGVLDCILVSEPVRDSENRIVDLRIVYRDRTGREALPDLFGNVVGRTWRDLLPPERIDERLGPWVRLIETGGTEDVRGLAGERVGLSSWLIDIRAVAVGGRLVSVWRDASEQTAIKRERKEAQILYRRLMEVANEGILILDAAGIVQLANNAVASMFGLNRATVIGRSALDVFGSAAGEANHALAEQGMREGASSARYEVAISRPDGAKAVLLVSSTPLYNADGVLDYSIMLFSDITETRRNEERYRLLAENSTDVISEVGLDGVVNYVSPSVFEVLGYTVDEVTGHRALEFFAPEDIPGHLDRMASLGDRPDVFTTLMRLQRKDGLTIWMESSARQRRDAVSGKVIDLLVASRDVTTRVRALQELEDKEEQLRHRAVHDALTGLPNRDLLFDRLERALVRARRSGENLAVLFVDIDDLEYVNDSFGHDFGDQVLVEVGMRIVAGARQADTVARFGGDEYVVVCEMITDVAQALSIAERISAKVRADVEISGNRLRVTVSIGVILGGDEVYDAKELLRNADLAMSRAKQLGCDRSELFDAALGADAIGRLKVGTELRDAVDQWQFLLHYQPIVNLESGRVTGCEALLRWQHPTRGLLYPPDFLTVAENSGLITRIGARVLLDACRQGAIWMSELCDMALTVAVNVSLNQLAWGDFRGDLDWALESSGFDPALLQLELTETALLDVAAIAQSDLSGLVRRGITIGIDDFGTGYSSLTYLKRFPVGFLKIDRAFVEGLGTDEEDTAIVNAIIKLAQTLSLDTVAEGVASAAQLAALRNAGCTLAQGRFFGQPAPAEGMMTLIDRIF